MAAQIWILTPSDHRDTSFGDTEGTFLQSRLNVTTIIKRKEIILINPLVSLAHDQIIQSRIPFQYIHHSLEH